MPLQNCRHFSHTKTSWERNFRALNDSGSDEEKNWDFLSIWVRLILYCSLYFFISSVQMRRRVPVTNDVIDSIRSMVKSVPFQNTDDKETYYTSTTFTRSTKCGNDSSPFFNSIYLTTLHLSTIVVGGEYLC